MGHPSVKASIFLAEISILADACAGCGRAVAPTAAFPKRVPGSESTIRLSLARQDLPAGLGPGVGFFYPLQLGNHWGYEHVLSIVVIPDSGPPGPAFGLRDRRDRDLVCIEQRAGRSYVVERESFGGGLFTWV